MTEQKIWPLKKLVDVLERSMLTSGPIGFGPILPPDVEDSSKYFASVRFWGPTHSHSYAKLRYVWERLKALEDSLKKEVP